MKKNPLVLVLDSGRNVGYLLKLSIALDKAGYDMVKLVDQLDLLTMIEREEAACALVNLYHHRAKAILSGRVDMLEPRLAKSCPLILYSGRHTEGSTMMIQKYLEEGWFTDFFNGFPDPAEFAKKVDELVRKAAE